MNRKDGDAINRRDFLKSGTAAVVAANYLGLQPALVHAGPRTPPVAADSALEIMKASVAAVQEINDYLKRTADEIDRLKTTKAAHIPKAECEKVVQIVDAVVIVVVASVIAAFTFGAGAPLSSHTSMSAAAIGRELTAQLARLTQWESQMMTARLMESALRAVIASGRQKVENVKDVVVARDIFFHLSQDKAHATRLLEAARARNRTAIGDMLRRDAPGSNVVVQDVKEANGVLLNARINNFIYCLSTSGQCGGKQITFAR